MHCMPASHAGRMLGWTDPVGWPAAGKTRTEKAPADAEDDDDDVSAHLRLSGSILAPSQTCQPAH